MTQKRGKVVIAEDEMFIRMDLMLYLEDEGLEVLSAGNAEEALHLLRQEGPFDLLITDVNMPGDLDGIELAGQVSQMYPNMKVIVTSGNPRYADVLPAKSVFVPKPYNAPDLAEHAVLEITHTMPRHGDVGWRRWDRHAG